MNNVNIVEQATRSMRRTQTGLTERKESLSALVALVAWVATIIADNMDSIPAEAGQWGQVLAVVCSVLAVAIARFTVPALTKGQAAQLVSRAETLQTVEERRTAPITLPVHDLPTTAPVSELDGGRHRAD